MELEIVEQPFQEHLHAQPTFDIKAARRSALTIDSNVKTLILLSKKS